MTIKDIKFIGKYIITTNIKAKTGLHVGTANSVMEIGGVDNPVIKDPLGIPYIPGSSIKGKMRSLMEFEKGLINPDNLIYSKESKNEKDEVIRLHMCDNKDCLVCNLFGRNHGNHKLVNDEPLNLFESIVPTRLIVRDAMLEEDSITEEMKKNMDLEWTEVKFENNLDRITSAANPRQTERVPAGAVFQGEFILNVYNVDGKDDGVTYLKGLINAMKLLEDDYLGGQGSRGYGKIAFGNIVIKYRSKGYYEGSEGEVVWGKGDNIENLEKSLNY